MFINNRYLISHENYEVFFQLPTYKLVDNLFPLNILQQFYRILNWSALNSVGRTRILI